MMETREEKKNRQIGIFTSVGIHALLLILFIFIMAWRQQIPPPEPIGMSINFGTSDVGSGDVQPRSEQEQSQESVQEQQEETVEETQPQEETPVDNTQETVTETVQKEGPVKVEEKKVEEKKPVEEKVETKPVETKTEEEKKEEVVEEKKLEAVYKGPTTDKTNTETNEGTKENTTGDQGKEEGQLDSRTQYGGPGEGGGGFSHNMTGWGTEFKLPDDKPEAEGVLEFKIKIDERGEIVSISFQKRIGNTSAENFYRDYISRNMRFFRLANAGDIPPYSEGVITLNLKVK